MPLTVNLDPIAAMLDAALAHPMMGAIESTLPGATAQVRTIRENLPEVAAGLEAVGRSLDRALVRAIGAWLAPPSRGKRKKPKRLKSGGKKR